MSEKREMVCLHTYMFNHFWRFIFLLKIKSLWFSPRKITLKTPLLNVYKDFPLVKPTLQCFADFDYFFSEFMHLIGRVNETYSKVGLAWLSNYFFFHLDSIYQETKKDLRNLNYCLVCSWSLKIGIPCLFPNVSA